jgi:hypothetical protein
MAKAEGDLAPPLKLGTQEAERIAKSKLGKRSELHLTRESFWKPLSFICYSCPGVL